MDQSFVSLLCEHFDVSFENGGALGSGFVDFGSYFLVSTSDSLVQSLQGAL